MQTAFGLLTLGSLLVTFIAHLSVRAVLRRRRCIHSARPPITVLKPLKGIEDGLFENLCSFARQDHPGVQLVFGATDPDDRALALARRVRDLHPEVDVAVVAGARAFGLNPKVTNLASMAREAKHALWLVSDSNVRVGPDYVSDAVDELLQPGVGMVTHLFAGTGGASLGARLENLHSSTWVAGGMALSQVFTGAACVVGKSMAFRRDDLERVGGLHGVRDVLAEDYVLGRRFARAGWKVVTATKVIESVNRTWTVGRFCSRHQRWGQLRLRLAPLSFALEPLTNPVLFATMLALSGAPGLALAAVAAKLVSDALLARRLLGRWPRAQDVALIPLKDLCVAWLWVLSALRREVEWRGQRLVVGRGTVLQVPSDPESSPATTPALHLRP